MRRAPMSPLLALSLVTLCSASGRAQAVEATRAGTGESTAVAPLEGSGQAAVSGEHPPSEADTAIASALTLFDGGAREDGTEAFLAWLAAHPEAELAAVRYSRELGARAAWDEAIAFLDAYLGARQGAGQSDPMASLELGVLLQALLRYEEAIPHFRAVPAEAGLTHEMAQLNLGKAYRVLGRFEEARLVYGPLRSRGAGVFVAAALCEITLASDGPDAAAGCVAEARERFGDHPALVQAEALTAYRQGDFGRAAELVDQLLAYGGSPGPRTTTLRALIVLARSGPREAARAVESIDQVSVLGERDALTAMMLAAAGDLEAAGQRYRAAVARNPLFGDPGEAARRLGWRPEAAAAFELAANPPDEPATDADDQEVSLPSSSAAGAAGSGCCRAAASTYDRPMLPLWLLTGVALLRSRRAAAGPAIDLGR